MCVRFQVYVISSKPFAVTIIAAHLDTAPDTFVVIGLVISLHIAGMYALSPVMGHLADRWGRVRLTAAGLGTLTAACLLAGAGRASVPAVTVGLVLLGLGWSAATVAGSARVSELVTGAERVLVQGVTDAGMGLAGAFGAGLAGVVLGVLGYGGLAVLAAVLALAVALGVLRGVPSHRTVTTPLISHEYQHSCNIGP